MKYRTIGKAAVALLLAAALLFSAVGCGPQAQTVPETSSSSAAAPEPADSPEESAPDQEDLPVGIILAILGAPFFLYVLRGRSKHDVAGKKYFHQIRRKNSA